MTEDRNCLTYWLPRLEAAGLPVPRTAVVDAGEGWTRLLDVFEMAPRHAESQRAARAALDDLAARIAAAAEGLGCGHPFFLRTGQGSGKHRWKDCCHVGGPEAIPQRVANLIEWSATVDFLGLPWRYWVVRELLPVEPVAVLTEYGDMPLAPEARFFVRGGDVVCRHPYWPTPSIAEGLAEGERCRAQEYASTIDTRIFWTPGCLELAQRVAWAFAGDGAWSVDLLLAGRAWYVTDMAEAHRSFHFEGCTHAAALQGGTP